MYQTKKISDGIAYLLLLFGYFFWTECFYKHSLNGILDVQRVSPSKFRDVLEATDYGPEIRPISNCFVSINTFPCTVLELLDGYHYTCSVGSAELYEERGVMSSPTPHVALNSLSSTGQEWSPKYLVASGNDVLFRGNQKG